MQKEKEEEQTYISQFSAYTYIRKLTFVSFFFLFIFRNLSLKYLLENIFCYLTLVVYQAIISEHALCSTRLHDDPLCQDWDGILLDTGKPPQTELGLRRQCSPAKAQESAQHSSAMRLFQSLWWINAIQCLKHNVHCSMYDGITSSPGRHQGCICSL